MSAMHIVVGSGTVGTHLAKRLGETGESVLLLSRTNNRTELKNVKRIQADAASFSSLITAAPQADYIYNCVNPPYNKWEELWPPINQALIELAKKTGAVLVTCSNLYGYGPHNGVLTEDLPLNATWKNGRVRADMWLKLKELHDAGEIRASEVRGSDYIAASDQSRMGDRVVPQLKEGKGVQLLGELDKLHTWTDPEDVANLMMVVAKEEVAWGKPWHVPSNDPMTQRHVIRDIALELGVKDPKVSPVPAFVAKVLGLVNPVIRELSHTEYQFNEPFIMSDEKARKTFGLKPKPWQTVIKDLVDQYKIAN
ncbi:MAG: NAD-dependent epimerase/dehydratase family protein [Candidatus Nanopelagicaceae bacterium]|nr:NAD-dependent epimerase/dehydratase family protein [Candidatus Nanopelagicaceae bacterium]